MKKPETGKKGISSKIMGHFNIPSNHELFVGQVNIHFRKFINITPCFKIMHGSTKTPIKGNNSKS